MKILKYLQSVLLFFLCFFSIDAPAQPKLVIYPSDNPRFAEYIETLRTALDKTVEKYGPYTMKPAELVMNEARYLEEVKNGKTINVVWSATSIEKERNLIPVRIPLTKGLLGYRIVLIRSDMQSKINKAQTAADLSAFSFGLGKAWGDVSIYSAAGFKIQFGEYESLFRMLNIGRFDIFSRGVNEIFPEYDKQSGKNPNIAIEQKLLLHYTYPFYFFVTPADPALAERIDTGMRQMIKDGSFDAIFWKYNGKAITRANMDSRRIIELKNPNVPPNTSVENPQLWYTPNRKKP